jgi:hypothetical protein
VLADRIIWTDYVCLWETNYVSCTIITASVSLLHDVAQSAMNKGETKDRVDLHVQYLIGVLFDLKTRYKTNVLGGDDRRKYSISQISFRTEIKTLTPQCAHAFTYTISYALLPPQPLLANTWRSWNWPILELQYSLSAVQLNIMEHHILLLAVCLSLKCVALLIWP